MDEDRNNLPKSTLKHPSHRIATLTVAAYLAFGTLFLLILSPAASVIDKRVPFGVCWLLLGISAAVLFLVIRRGVVLLEEVRREGHEGAGSDPVTGLPDRSRFDEIFARALSRCRSGGQEFEVMCLDLDRFRNIVRTLGHDAGREILRQVAGRLTEVLDGSETLVHIASDQFIILAPENGSPEKAEGLASRLLLSFQRPFYYLDHPLYLRASIGIALYPHDGREQEVLIKNAYAAANRAKEMGGNHYQFYFHNLSEYAASTLLLENRLHEALESEEFVLLFQPQESLASGRIEGMEVLVSWKHPAHPGLTPSEFIPLAEESGLIEALGEWILRTACLQNRRWQEAGLPPMRMAVNVSARQFYRGNLVELVTDILAESRLDPRWLVLEITETVLMQDVEETINTLYRLNRLGLQVAVDDFGTGYSSLSCLKKFPIHTLKLDRSFVDNLPADPEATAIVSAVIAMGHAMNLEVVGEGVERREQWDFLAEKGCDKVQGFLVSHPLEGEDFASFIGKNAGSAAGRREGS